MEKKSVVIYIPAHNEEDTIGDVIKIIRKYYSNPEDYYVKIVVVDDGSKDNTRKIAEQLNVDHIVVHPKNQGLGAATRSGLRQAYEMGADIAVKIDADFQHDPSDIDKVIRPILEDKSDVVFGSRFMGKINYKMPLYRRMGNSFFSFLTQFFTGLRVTDGQTGLIATDRRYLKCFRLTSDYNETQQMIIDAWRNQLRFMEVPVVFHKRKAGESFISWKYPFIVFPNIFRLFIHACPLKIFLPIGILLILSSIVTLYMFLNRITMVGEDTVIALFIGGLQIILFGLIADIVSKKRST
ncbi:glycosyltransferase family 2 protein [Candidatus Woesearchaeota archaeon]|nr:glycosyltransferase family 2 protein [Candidatus Woesearchaeota archaeon]